MVAVVQAVARHVIATRTNVIVKIIGEAPDNDSFLADSAKQTFCVVIEPVEMTLSAKNSGFDRLNHLC